MPLPLIVGGIAAVAGVAGVGSGIHGGVKMKEANDTMKKAKYKQENALLRFELRNNKCTQIMDEIGKKELDILSSFDYFSELIEKIQGRPKFKNYNINGVDLPEYEAEELKKISAGAGLLLGGVGGAAAGTAGGFAAAGATTSAVMALGTASTGTAISSLSGAAATKATLAALGGGAIKAGGGGIALGSTILGGATLGVGLLVGGIIFNVTGTQLSSKADEAYKQATRTEEEVEKVCKYLRELIEIAEPFKETLENVDNQYRKRLNILDNVINFSEKTNWEDFTPKEKKMTHNLVLLVGLLNKMCMVNLVIKDVDNDNLNEVNKEDSAKIREEAEKVLGEIENA